MARTDRTILNSDFDTLKNDAAGNATVIIPGSVSLGAGAIAYYTTDIVLGEAQSLLNIRLQSLKEGTQYFLASIQTSFARAGSLGGYNIIITCYHLTGNTIRCQAIISNPYSSAMTTAGGQETFNFSIKTFKQPRFS